MRSLSFAFAIKGNKAAIFPETATSLPLSFWLCSYRSFQDRCKRTASTQCDFSHLSKYGDYTVRVRAELADEHSEWVNVTFCPVEDSKPCMFPLCYIKSSYLASVPISKNV